MQLEKYFRTDTMAYLQAASICQLTVTPSTALQVGANSRSFTFGTCRWQLSGVRAVNHDCLCMKFWCLPCRLHCFSVGPCLVWLDYSVVCWYCWNLSDICTHAWLLPIGTRHMPEPSGQMVRKYAPGGSGSQAPIKSLSNPPTELGKQSPQSQSYESSSSRSP